MRSRGRKPVSDQLLPQQGARPWLPADNVTAVEILNQYNIPLAGLIEQDCVTYLYVCLLGELEELNIWAYALLGDAVIARLRSLVDDEVDAAIRIALTNTTLVIALAADHKLVDWIVMKVGTEDLLAIAARFVEQMQSRRDAIQKDVASVERQRQRELADR
jgi:hypothetical protein